MDPANSTAVVPVHPDESVAVGTPSCISVKAIAHVDGDVQVQLLKLGEDVVPPGLIEVFAGEIETPNRRLAVVTSALETVVEMDVFSDLTPVRISVTDARFPDQIVVEAR
jgi:hypothetical protein